MARLPRVCPIGIPQHVIQRGNNHQACFASTQDFATYAHNLRMFAHEFEVEIHAWVFMTNHVHLLCTPRSDNGISKMMQALGRKYVRYFNITYQRTGTLWEGRFKSCLIEDEAYLLQVYRYIELNPVRAGMVDNPADYQWSSYQVNALGKVSELCCPHVLYQAIANTRAQRCQDYQELCTYALSEKSIKEIRNSSKSGMALGSDKFKREIEQLTGRRMQAKQRGRSVGWRKVNV